MAPLDLPGIIDATYTLTVRNGSDEQVWSRQLSSARFGTGAGSLSFVGPCDAADNDNTVELVLDALYDAQGEIDPLTYQNPTPLRRTLVCVADEDLSVVFDMTIVRDAQQGFFDIAVSFSDLFCSAKLDCQDAATGDDLLLLHDTTGARKMSVVLGFACAGAVSGPTYLYLDPPQINCTGFTSPIQVDPTGKGRVDLSAPGSTNPDGYLFAASVFRGQEELASKAYWNISFGLDNATFASAGDCTLSARATAAREPLVGGASGFMLPADSVYPVVEWSVPLSNATGRVCSNHPINVPGSGVATAYADWHDSPAPFFASYARGASFPAVCGRFSGGTLLAQAASQPDPTTTGSAAFSVIFDGPIDMDSFTASDITLSSSLNGASVAQVQSLAQVAPFDQSAFEFTVTQLTSGETISASLPAGAVDDGCGVSNAAPPGLAASLDGSDDHLDLGSDSVFRPTTGAFSVVMDIFNDGDTTAMYFSNWFGGGWNGFNLGTYNEDTVSVHVGHGGYSGVVRVQSTSLANDGVVHHIVGTYDGAAAEVAIYVDGVLEDSATAPTYLSYQDDQGDGHARLGVAESNNGYFFNGQLDNVMIFDVALTPAQVLDTMAGIVPVGAAAHLLAHYDFESGDGSDSSGAGRDAALVNGALVEPWQGVDHQVTAQ